MREKKLVGRKESYDRDKYVNPVLVSRWQKAPEMLSPSIEDMNACPHGFAPKLVH